MKKMGFGFAVYFFFTLAVALCHKKAPEGEKGE